jgi:hypothetical protein
MPPVSNVDTNAIPKTIPIPMSNTADTIGFFDINFSQSLINRKMVTL